jgi:hypothetical protein
VGAPEDAGDAVADHQHIGFDGVIAQTIEDMAADKEGGPDVHRIFLRLRIGFSASWDVQAT